MDIHMFVERQVNSVWERVPEEEGIDSPYLNAFSNEKIKEKYASKTWDPGVNVALFGTLAGVASKIYLPFIAPRGLPEDVSEEIKVLFEEKKHHTPHHLTLLEILKLQETVEVFPVYLNALQFKKYKKENKVPDGGSFLPPKGAEIVGHEKMTRIMNLASFYDDYAYVTQVETKVSYKEISEHFWVDEVEAMKKVAEDPNNIRCVFWFDN